MKSIPSGPTGAERSFDSGGSAECRVKFINLTLVADTVLSQYVAKTQICHKLQACIKLKLFFL